MDELVDIVDENDNVIGQKLKSECHAHKILHRSAGVLLFKDKTFKEILMQVRSKKKARRPGVQCIPGGHLTAGETYLEGIKKELQEEQFHNQELPEEISFEELYKIKKDTDDDHEFTTIFRAVHPGPFNHDPNEVASSHFIEINTLLKNIDENPLQYDDTTRLHLKEYQKRFLL